MLNWYAMSDNADIIVIILFAFGIFLRMIIKSILESQQNKIKYRELEIVKLKYKDEAENRQNNIPLCYDENKK